MAGYFSFPVSNLSLLLKKTPTTLTFLTCSSDALVHQHKPFPRALVAYQINSQLIGLGLKALGLPSNCPYSFVPDSSSVLSSRSCLLFPQSVPDLPAPMPVFAKPLCLQDPLALTPVPPSKCLSRPV